MTETKTEGTIQLSLKKNVYGITLLSKSEEKMFHAGRQFVYELIDYGLIMNRRCGWSTQ